MVKDFKTFETKSLTLPLVGIPSGEYFDITAEQFNILNERGFLTYDSKLKSMTYIDSDYHSILLHIKDNNKEKIKKFLSIIGVKRYKINDDYTVDTLESVKIRMPLGMLPIAFDYIMGDFDISTCGLMTLKGCPEEIEGNFICTNNLLQDLEFGPKKVGGNYDVRQSGINNLTGSPDVLTGDFICSYNNLEDLIGGPRIVDGSYYVDNCLLTTLEGSPDVLGNNFDCSYNLLHDLKYGPDMINGVYNCSNNDILTLKNGPASVGTFKCTGNNKLKDLSLAPGMAKIISDIN